MVFERVVSFSLSLTDGDGIESCWDLLRNREGNMIYQLEDW
jgi:hypothetical protein